MKHTVRRLHSKFEMYGSPIVNLKCMDARVRELGHILRACFAPGAVRIAVRNRA